MSLFGKIVSKIFHHDAAMGAQPTSSPKVPPEPSPANTSSATGSAPAPEAHTAPVDVGAVLEAMAAMKDDHGGNYRTSIVDLLKLLDLDSSLAARKELADELDVHEGEDGSAEQNIALHRAVMNKLAANGGMVPDTLRFGSRGTSSG